MKFGVEILSRSFNSSVLVPRLDYAVRDYEWDVMGGPDIARIEATGDEMALWQLRRWLRAPITITDETGRKVWWGYVREVTLSTAGVEVGVSLDQMRNRIACLFSYAGGDTSGYVSRAITAWAQDDASVLAYGYKEMIDAMGDLKQDEAEARRDALLEQLKYPVQVTRPGGGSASSATIECAGWWHTLDWQHFSRSSSGVAHASDSSGTQKVGSDNLQEKVAQSFVPTRDFKTNQVRLSLATEGSPIDGVTVSILNDNAGQPSGTPIAETTVPASDVTGSQIAIDLGALYGLSSGVAYWLVLGRTGVVDAGNHFTVSLDTSAGYGDGNALRLENGAWVGIGGDLEFEISSAQETTDQIVYALTNAAQFIEGVTVEDQSGVYTHEYRSGDHTTLYEVDSLLSSGVVGGGRLLATVTPERYIRVYEEPVRPNHPAYVWGRDGKIRQVVSDRVLSQECPVGDWVEVVGVPPVPEGDLLAGSNVFFIEHASYSVDQGRYAPTPRGSRGSYDL